MKRKNSLRILGLMILLGLTVLAGACNDTLDNEDESNNLLKVSSIAPSNICIDGDGELIDEDGDGTLADPAERFFTDVLVTFTISSTLKNPGASSAFNDVVIEKHSIEYSNGAPKRGGGLTVTIPAGGSTTVGIVAVNSADIGANFGPGASGTATFSFTGADVAGKRASATAKMSFSSVSICQ